MDKPYWIDDRTYPSWILSPGTQLTETESGALLVDRILGETHPMNGSAHAILAEIVNGSTIDELSAILAQRYQADQALIRADAIQLLGHLNSHELVQPKTVTFSQEWSYYRLLLVRLFGIPVGATPIARRIPLVPATPAATLARIARGVWWAWRLPFCAVMGLAALLALLDSPGVFWVPGGLAGLFGAILLHEFPAMGYPCYLAARPDGISVVRLRGKRWQEAVVGASGP